MEKEKKDRIQLKDFTGKIIKMPQPEGILISLSAGEGGNNPFQEHFKEMKKITDKNKTEKEG